MRIAIIMPSKSKQKGNRFEKECVDKAIEKKLKSYLHHREFDENPMTENEINEIMKNKKKIF